MLLTEDEARGNKDLKIAPKQCRNVPLILVEMPGSSLSPNQKQMSYQGAPCIASACVNWRWWTVDRGYGFCGLSGVPLGPSGPLGRVEPSHAKGVIWS